MFAKYLVPFLQHRRFQPERRLYTKAVKENNVNNKLVVLATNRKWDNGSNLAYLKEALDKTDYTVKILETNKIHPEAKDFYVLLSQAKYLIIDDFFQLFYALDLRKETLFIQVWHALGAYKTFGYGREGKAAVASPYSLTHRNYTSAITSSTSLVDIYAKSFGISKDKVIPTGIPRSDLFFREDKIKESKDHFYLQYPELKDKKIILFAPTFRGESKKNAHYPLEYFPLDKFAKSLKDDEVLILRQHPFVKERMEIPLESKDKIYDLSDYSDINGLLLVSKLLITDYSSLIFEASLANLTTIFYLPDLKEYINERDFYYPFETYKIGEVYESFDKLLEGYHQAKPDETKVADLKKRFMDRCDGKATQRFIAEILERK